MSRLLKAGLWWSRDSRHVAAAGSRVSASVEAPVSHGIQYASVDRDCGEEEVSWLAIPGRRDGLD